MRISEQFQQLCERLDKLEKEILDMQDMVEQLKKGAQGNRETATKAKKTTGK